MVTSFQGMSCLLARVHSCPQSVTYVRVLLLPMCPVCTLVAVGVELVPVLDLDAVVIRVRDTINVGVELNAGVCRRVCICVCVGISAIVNHGAGVSRSIRRGVRVY